MKIRPAVRAALLGAAFFLISWFLWTDSRHFIDGGDVFFPIDQLVLFSKLSSVWWPDQFGFISYNLAVAPLRGIFALLQLIGLSSIAIDRIFLAVGYGIAAAGMYLLAAKFWRDRSTPIIAALWYVGSISYCMAVPNENNVVALAILPVLLFLGLKALDDLLYAIPFAAVALLFGFLVPNPPTVALLAAIIAAVWIIGASGRAPLQRVGLVGILLLAGAVATNLWWFPVLKATLTGNEIVAAGVQDVSWALARSNLISILEQTSFWGFGAGSDPWRTLGQWYLNNPIPHTALVLTPILAFACLWFDYPTRARRYRIAALTVLCVIAALLAKGEHPPFSMVSSWVYDVPGMFLFREPVKFVFIIALVLPLLAAITHFELASRFPRWGPIFAGLVFLAVPIVTGWTLLTGRAFAFPASQAARVQIPAYWHKAIAYINAKDTENAPVLLLPEDGFYQTHYRWGLVGVDRIAETGIRAPVVRLTAQQYAYLQNRYGAQALKTLDEALRSQNRDWIRTEFERLSIGYVILRTDLTPDGRILSVPEVRYDLQGAGVQHVARFGALDIYKTVGLPRLGDADRVLRSCASPTAESEAAMRLPLTVTVIRSYTALCDRSPSSLQMAWKKTSAPAGSVVVSFRATQPAPLRPNPQLRYVSARLRFAPRGLWEADYGVVPSQPASFCGPWQLEHSDKGWSARRCIRTAGAAYIRFSGVPQNLTYPLDTMFQWGRGGASFALPIPATLMVPRDARFAEFSIMPNDLADVRRGMDGLRMDSIMPAQRVPAEKMVYYSVHVPLGEQLSVAGVSGPIEFFYRMPSGRRFSAFQTSAGPTSYNPLQIFERIYQSGLQSRQDMLRHKDVLLEGVALPFLASAGSADPLVVTPDTPKWSVRILSHAAVVTSSATTDVYVGKPEAPSDLSIATLPSDSPTRIQVRTRSAGWIVMRQSYSDAWALPASHSHAVADGYANAWLVPSAGNYLILAPLGDVEKWFYVISAVCFSLFVAVVLTLRWKAREPA